MNIRNLKIASKLAISVAAFLLPLGIMLFSIISISFTSIKKGQKELQGIKVLRPAMSLVQTIPHFIRYSVDGARGDIDYVMQYASELFVELDENYSMYFSDYSSVSIQSLRDRWIYISGDTGLEKYIILESYDQLIKDLYQLILYTGDISSLITDSELECAYLIAAAVQELPQAQERMVTIGNLLRDVGNVGLTDKLHSELELNLNLLIFSDNARIQKRFNTAGLLKTDNLETLESLEVFEFLMKTCYQRIEFFSQSVDYVVNTLGIDEHSLSVLYEAATQANSAAFRLQNASLDRLEILITNGINTHEKRLIRLLSLSLLATILAFTIIIATVIYIRKSTNNLGKVFKRLDDNDLTVKLEVLSRDELGEIMLALSGFLEKLKTAFALFNEEASTVSTAVNELSSSTREITTTANEQSASVAEIVSTMENSKDLSIQVADKTIDVANLAQETQGLSRHGADLHKANEDMMLNIREKNAKIVDEIKNLHDVISRIDESVQSIDMIADRTKLIAFNAALEASSSGEAGLRFAVVAGEIRRFADNVVESVAEIKERIEEVQKASGTLISEADIGSQAIDMGYHRMVEQQEVYKNIADVSQNVAVRSQEISRLSKQQELASEQVFATLKEISAGVRQFVTATASTSVTADKLNTMSHGLEETLSKYHISKLE